VPQVFNQRLPDENSLRSVHRVVVLKALIWSSAHGIEISRYLRSPIELITGHLGLIIVEVQEPFNPKPLNDSLALNSSILVADFLLIRYCDPVLRDSQAKSHLGLKVRLVEAGKHAEAVKSLKLSVEVLFPILLIDERVKTHPVVIVWGEVIEEDLVPAKLYLSWLQWDHVILEAALVGNREAVDAKVGDS
jgi:hypothetical protein